MATETLSADRLHELGEARLKVAETAKTPEQLKELWKEPANAYPFKWGECWKQCTQYCVKDFAAEVGFFIDVLGFPTNAFGPDYAMFTSPEKDFFFAIVPANDENTCTAPESITLGFMIQDLPRVAKELESRGVEFSKPVKPCAEGAALHSGSFRTPNGVEVTIWGMVSEG